MNKFLLLIEEEKSMSLKQKLPYNLHNLFKLEMSLVPILAHMEFNGNK